MPYRSPFVPAVYPDESGRPSAMEYRIVFTAREPWLAILHLRQTDQEYASPVASAAVRDVVLNRLLENDLRSLPLSALRLVASDASGDFEYRISPDIHDYIERGNRYTIARTRTGRQNGRIDQDRLAQARRRQCARRHASRKRRSIVAGSCSSPRLTNKAQPSDWKNRKPATPRRDVAGFLRHCQTLQVATGFSAWPKDSGQSAQTARARAETTEPRRVRLRISPRRAASRNPALMVFRWNPSASATVRCAGSVSPGRSKPA